MPEQAKHTDSTTIVPDTIIPDSAVTTPIVTDTVSTATTTAYTPEWTSGLDPIQRSEQPGNDSGFLLIISLMLVIMAFNFRHLRRLLKTYAGDLLRKNQGRGNVFDEHSAGDIRILLMLIAQSIICAGILLAKTISQISTEQISPVSVSTVAIVSCIIGGCYIFQLTAYRIVGYTFSTPEITKQWIRAFNASQAILGIALLIPAVLSIFYPEVSFYMIIVGLILYFGLRTLFIYKGFRIFYTNFVSLFYFILYLCTLEIIPLITVYKSSLILTPNIL